MYKAEPSCRNMTIEVKTRRKGKNGLTKGKRLEGENRNGKTGVVARVYKNGELIDSIPSSTFKKLSSLVRSRYNIHPSIVIKKHGITKF